jgi:hypothetical protein
MFTADQLVCHAIGDYIFQSQWMADNKRKSDWAAYVHAVTYTLPFVLVTQNAVALAIIFVTHYLIDRYGLARYVVWVKNWPFIVRDVVLETPAGIDLPWVDIELKPITATGYPDHVPPFLAIWLLIAADNILHVLCNGLAIYYFG